MVEERVHTDGRVARGVRTRRRIVDAHTALLREGVLKPTAHKIAECAGVSVRTLWANFHDLEGLLAETTQFWLDADAALVDDIDLSKPLDQRIDDYCSGRARRLENIAPAARSASLGEPFSPALQASRAEHIARLRTEIEHIFAAEIATASEPRRQLVDALAAIAGWPSWDMWRADFGVSADAARGNMRHGLRALLRA